MLPIHFQINVLQKIYLNAWNICNISFWNWWHSLLVHYICLLRNILAQMSFRNKHNYVTMLTKMRKVLKCCHVNTITSAVRTWCASSCRIWRPSWISSSQNRNTTPILIHMIICRTVYIHISLIKRMSNCQILPWKQTNGVSFCA